MIRLKFFILIFCAALSIPMGYFVWHAHRSLAQEEISELRYFASTLFEQMEEELAAFIQKEEARAVDEYTWQPKAFSGEGSSRLSQPPEETYILGYLQNNPDGSFQTPLVRDPASASSDRHAVIDQLKEINRIFNGKRSAVSMDMPFKPAEMAAATTKEDAPDIAGKYFDSSRSRKKKSYLGRKEKRVEEVPVRQALNIAPQSQREMTARLAGELPAEAETDPFVGSMPEYQSHQAEGKESALDLEDAERETAPKPAIAAETETFQVEVDPMQSVFIDDSRIFIFRRIVIRNQIYRQGFVVYIKPFLRHMAETHFIGQPMAQFTSLQLKIFDQGQETEIVRTGATAEHPIFALHQTFPRPFSFIRATLTCDRIPKSTSRRTLNIMMGLATLILLIGLLAIYHSVRTLVDLSERRSSFVSSVTHELKTPLTNIRMYIEMLEQGIARTKDREQDYFRILSSESARLSRLINNVLEFSRLEKKQRYADLQAGTFEEVIREVVEVMQAKLRQEGFTLKVEQEAGHVFLYDREMMIQVLINLIENSMKFGKNAESREITIRVRHEDGNLKISVSDKGPGIPRSALKKVFDDFFRVESELVRNTKGTGIGLALVKRFVTAMGGSVKASDNTGPGCTITISMSPGDTP